MVFLLLRIKAQCSLTICRLSEASPCPTPQSSSERPGSTHTSGGKGIVPVCRQSSYRHKRLAGFFHTALQIAEQLVTTTAALSPLREPLGIRRNIHGRVGSHSDSHYGKGGMRVRETELNALDVGHYLCNSQLMWPGR